MLQIVPKPGQGPETTAPEGAVSTIYKVSGMSCGHCATAVTEELTSIAGVGTVQVDVTSGTVTVWSDHALNEADVREAIDEAGYELV